jgi:hypothetical protein
MILGEVVKHLQANNATFDDAQAQLLIRLLNDAYPQAEVEPTATDRRKVKELDMPDEDDRHVLAAAVSARADILCTNNIKDFPPEAMTSLRIELLTADALFSRLVKMHPSKMLAAHRTAVASLTGAGTTYRRSSDGTPRKWPSRYQLTAGASDASGLRIRRSKVEAPSFSIRVAGLVDDAAEVLGGAAVGGVAELAVVLDEQLRAVALTLGDGADVEAGVEQF